MSREWEPEGRSERCGLHAVFEPGCTACWTYIEDDRARAMRRTQGIGIVGELRRIVDSIDAVAREGGDTSELVARASALIDLLEARL